jgi:hypothetical protein
METVTFPEDSGFRAIPSTAALKPMDWARPQIEAVMVIAIPAQMTDTMKKFIASACILYSTSFFIMM